MGHANISVFVPHIGCPHQCSFCNQRSICGQQIAPTPQQVQQTCQQALSLRAGKLAQTELAFFGGSFTAIDRDYMVSLLQAAKPYIGPEGFAGIRLSTRPDAIDPPILKLLQSYGVSAIELGVQSMSDRVLQANGRGHTAEDVRQAARLIRQAGFALGLQMMTGLYESTIEDDWNTAREIAALSPQTVRIYPTITIRGTELADLYAVGRYHPMSLEQVVQECSGLLAFFNERGIRVIRLGLHAQESLQRDYVAGPYHPAFRELCEGRLYLEEARRQAAQFPQGTPLWLWVSPNAVSKMAGQHRCNLQQLALRNPVKIRTSPTMQPLAVLVQAAPSRTEHSLPAPPDKLA